MFFRTSLIDTSKHHGCIFHSSTIWYVETTLELWAKFIFLWNSTLYLTLESIDESQWCCFLNYSVSSCQTLLTCKDPLTMNMQAKIDREVLHNNLCLWTVKTLVWPGINSCLRSKPLFDHYWSRHEISSFVLLFRWLGFGKMNITTCDPTTCSNKHPHFPEFASPVHSNQTWPLWPCLNDDNNTYRRSLLHFLPYVSWITTFQPIKQSISFNNFVDLFDASMQEVTERDSESGWPRKSNFNSNR